NPMDDYCFMTRDVADFEGHMWATPWLGLAAVSADAG
ncbi:MAG: lactoylglutathione lyase, partial [Comamonadaceae bacterium]|nr:lactoylglutathione lyase [Comamonadaceae bacterium]